MEKCQQLTTDAWGATHPEMTEHSVMDAFLHGLIDTEAAYSALDKEPANLDEALELTKRAMHNRWALLGNRGNNVRTVSFAEEEEREEKKIRVVRTDGAASNPVEECISKMEESMAKTKKQLEQILKLMQTQNQNQNQSKNYANQTKTRVMQIHLGDQEHQLDATDVMNWDMVFGSAKVRGHILHHLAHNRWRLHKRSNS